MQALHSMVIALTCMCVCVSLFCSVANDSSLGLSCVVEIRQGQGALQLTLQSNKESYGSSYPCIHLRAKL